MKHETDAAAAAVVLNGSKHHDSDHQTRTNGNENGLSGRDKHGDECDDCLVHEKLNPKGAEDEVVITRPEAIWRLTFLTSRVTLGSLNLISLCLKIPLVFLFIRMLLDILRAKQAAAAAELTTIEPPYEDAVAPVGKTESAESQGRKYHAFLSCFASSDRWTSIDGRRVRRRRSPTPATPVDRNTVSLLRRQAP